MEVLQEQKQLLSDTTATLFGKWEQMFREKTEEHKLLKAQLRALQDVSAERETTVKQLSGEAAHLKHEVARLKSTCEQGVSTSHQALTEKYDNLYQEHKQQKRISEANQQELLNKLKKERSKLRAWNRFSTSGSCPASSPLSSSFDPRAGESNTVGERVAEAGLPKEQPVFAGRCFIAANVSQNQLTDGLARPAGREERADDAYQRHVQSASEINQEAMVQDPGQVSRRDSTFINTRPTAQPILSSPDLPSISATAQSAMLPDTELGLASEMTLSKVSLPQTGHSDSTAPPSDEVAPVEVQDMEDDKKSDSDEPVFLGARTVRKTRVGAPSGARFLPTSNETEPVTIKSDADATPVPPKPPQLVRLVSSTSDSLDPSETRPAPKSPRMLLPPPLLLESPVQVAQQRIARLQSFRSDNLTREPLAPSGQSPLRIQQVSGQQNFHGFAPQATPLREIDVNVRNLLRVGKASDMWSKKRKSDDSRSVEAIPTIAEDGEIFSKKTRKTPVDGTPQPRLFDPPINDRLGRLLSPPSHQAPALKVLPDMPVSRYNIEHMDYSLKAAACRSAPREKRPYDALIQAQDKDWTWWDEATELLKTNRHHTPVRPIAPPRNVQEQSTQGTTLKPAALEELTTNPRPPNATAASSFSRSRAPDNKQPYRTLPLSTLTPSHFKLNPSANHDLDYAYTEVVRNRSERKCLPGCTRRECCGPKFSALAATLPTTITAPTTTNPSITTPLTAHDHTLLQSYLGAYYHVITAPSTPTATATAELASHLNAARTAHIANKYGKAHRAVHQRAASPPGFWNVDFPTTQQQVEEQKVAEERERREVERRWLEAVKNVDQGEKQKKGEKGDGKDVGDEGRGRNGGERQERGLWMFADE